MASILSVLQNPWLKALELADAASAASLAYRSLSDMTRRLLAGASQIGVGLITKPDNTEYDFLENMSLPLQGAITRRIIKLNFQSPRLIATGIRLDTKSATIADNFMTIEYTLENTGEKLYIPQSTAIILSA